MFAQPHAFAHRADHRAQLAAVPAGLGQAAVVGADAQLRADRIGFRKRLHVRARELLLKQLATLAGDTRQRFGVAALQVDLDRARRAAETAEQVALGGEGAGVGKADHHFIAHDALELADARLVLDPRADGAAAGPQQQVPVLELWLLVAGHVGRQAFADDAAHLGIHHRRRHARRKTEEGVDGRAFYRRQVVQARHQQPGAERRQQHQAQDPADLLAACVGPAHQQRGGARIGRVVERGQLLALEPAARGGRQHGDGHQERDRHRDRDRQRQVGEQLALDVLDEQHRQEHRDGRERGRQQRATDLLGTDARRLGGQLSALAQAHDVLGHHHRRVHHHAHRERQARQRDHVEAAAGQVQHDEGGQQRDGNGAGDQQGGARVAQEPPQAAHRQQHAGAEVARQQVDGAVDEQRGVETLLDAQPTFGQHAGAQFGDHFLHFGQRGEHVGAALAHHAQADRRIAVLVGEKTLLGPLQADGGDIAQAHRLAVAPGQDEVAQVLGRITAGEAQHVLAPPVLDRTARDVVGARRKRRDFRNGDAQRRGARQVQVDAQFFLRSAVDFDTGDAGHGLDARHDLFFDEAPVVADVAFGARQQLHEEETQRGIGILRAELHHRRAGVARQRRHAVQSAQHFHQHGAHVGADGEGEVDEGAAGIGVAVHLFQARDTLQHGFLRFEQFGLHFLRGGGAPAGLDGKLGTFDVGEELQRQSLQARQSEQADQRHHDGDRGGIFQGGVGQFHGGILVDAATLNFVACARP